MIPLDYRELVAIVVVLAALAFVGRLVVLRMRQPAEIHLPREHPRWAREG